MITILSFDDSPRTKCKALRLQECQSTLRSAILSGFSRGGTKFGSAIKEAQIVLQNGTSEYLPLVMFMSDGASGDGKSEMQSLRAALNGNKLLVKTIAFGPQADTSKLQKLAELGGGEFLQAADGVQLQECFKQAAASLGHSF